MAARARKWSRLVMTWITISSVSMHFFHWDNQEGYKAVISMYP